MPPTLAGRIAYDPPLPAVRDGLSPADGAGQRGQVHGGLRAPVLARARALGRGDQRHRPGLGRLRQLAARRHARASCSASSRAARRARRRRPAPRPSAARIVAECFGRFFGPEAADPIDYVDRPGAPTSGRAAATAASCRRAPGATTAPALRRADRPDPLGRGRDGDGLERLHGRRRRLGPGSRARCGRRDPLARIVSRTGQRRRVPPHGPAQWPPRSDGARRRRTLITKRS